MFTPATIGVIHPKPTAIPSRQRTASATAIALTVPIAELVKVVSAVGHQTIGQRAILTKLWPLLIYSTRAPALEELYANLFD